MQSDAASQRKGGWWAVARLPSGSLSGIVKLHWIVEKPDFASARVSESSASLLTRWWPFPQPKGIRRPSVVAQSGSQQAAHAHVTLL